MDVQQLETVCTQNRVIIGLLARLTIGVPEIRQVVTARKRNPAAYIAVYNSLDGSTSVTEAAQAAKVDKSTMSKVLKGWETKGIIYDCGSQSKPGYRGLLALPLSDEATQEVE